MAIKFSQFNLRTDHTSGMYLVGYDGNQNIHITVDNLFDDFINGTENTIAMFGTDGTVLADSIITQSGTSIGVAGSMTVNSDATFSTNIEVEGTADFNGNVNLGDESGDLITQTGTLYLNGPVKDTTDTLGAVDQVLLSDATGELTFTDLSDLHVGGAEVVEVPVKNVQGSALVKGDPVYISGSVGASGKLEVQLADASNTLKMPAVGLLKQDLADQAEGFAVVTGKLRNLITDPIDGVNPTENDVIYVKPSGTSGAALTTTKPVYGNFIQNIGKVGRVSTAADGNFVVSSILRTNDIPNLTPGRLWIGSTGNTIESQTLFVDEANARLGIGTSSPSNKLEVDGNIAVKTTSGNSGIKIITNNTSEAFLIMGDPDDNSMGGLSYNNSTNTLSIDCNNAERMRIDSSGNVGIGTTSPSRIFTVSRDNTSSISASFVSANNQSAITLSGSGTTSDTQVRLAAEGNDMLMYAGNSERMRIDSSGDLNIVNTGQASLNFTTNGSSDYARITGGKSGSGVGDLRFFTYSSGIAERLRINSSGNVGIGTTSPARPLHVNGAGTNFVAEFQSTDDKASILIQDDDTLNYIHSQDGYLSLGGQNALSANNLNINSSSGNVGIGTTSPSQKLHVNSGVTNTVAIFESTDTEAQVNFVDTTGTSSIRTRNDFRFNSGNTELVRFESGGNVGIGTTSPTSPLTVKSNSTSAADSGITIQANANTNPLIKLAEKAGDKARFHMYNAGVEKIAFYTDGTDNHISAGNLGIGTTSPGQKLQVEGDDISGATIAWKQANRHTGYLYSDSTGVGIYDAALNNAGIYLASNSRMDFRVNGSERMRIDSSGNVGIGGTTLTGWANKQVVLDSGSNVSAAFVMVNDTTGRTGTDGSVITLSGSDMYLIQRESADMIFRTANIERMRIKSSGTIQIGGTGTDNDSYSLTFKNGACAIARDNNDLELHAYDNMVFGVSNTSYPTSIERMRIASSGQIKFNEYGAGTFTGTATKTLGVDANGNVIETTNTSIDGSGTANYVTKWFDADTITDSVIYDDGTDVGIGTATPNSKLQVNGAVQVADDTDTASADKVGALRYRTSGNNSYVDMCMQTGASTYAWVNIVQNNW